MPMKYITFQETHFENCVRNWAHILAVVVVSAGFTGLFAACQFLHHLIIWSHPFAGSGVCRITSFHSALGRPLLRLTG